MPFEGFYSLTVAVYSLIYSLIRGIYSLIRGIYSLTTTIYSLIYLLGLFLCKSLSTAFFGPLVIVVLSQIASETPLNMQYPSSIQSQHTPTSTSTPNYLYHSKLPSTN